MVTSSVVKWKVLKNLFLISFMVLLVSGKSVYHENEKEDSSENSSDLYFNGAERTKSNDPLSKLSEEDLPKNGEIFEGDMVMDNELRRAVIGEENKKAAVYTSEEDGPRHWKDGRIPYVIHDSLSLRIRDEIPTAIKIFDTLTCVRFEPKEWDDKDYVEFRDGTGCSSSVGRKGGKQDIRLADGCHRFGTVQHEMMHSMGIIHEQSRPDRDTYVKVMFDNIKPKLLRNFQKYDYGRADNLDTPYNYNSIMHYSNHAFSDNGQDTLVSRFDENLHFGQRTMASESDIKQINRLYPCSKDYKAASDFLYKDMTATKVIERKRDALRDESKLKEFIDRFLKK